MCKKLGLLFPFVLCLLLSACQSEVVETKEKPAIPVTVSIPIVKDINLYVESVGTLEPFFSVEIRPQASGLIETVFVKQGEWVEAGTPLFHIDSKVLEIKVKEAEAQVLMDEASYAAAMKKRERYYGLAQKDLVAQAEWDEIEESTLKAKAIVAGDSAKLQATKLDLERCTLRAPADGRIGRFDLHTGTLVAREEVLTSLSRIDPLIVNFTLTEKEFAKLPTEELAVEVQLLCGQGCHNTGKVTFLDSRFDAKSGLIFIRGELQNPDQKLRPGQSVSVRVPVAVDPQKTLITRKAIKYNQQGPYVYVVSPENTLEFRQLILGEEKEDAIIVMEGIGPAEQVVTSGHTRLSPGLKVEIQQ